MGKAEEEGDWRRGQYCNLNKGGRREERRGEGGDQSVAFTGLEGEFLLIHGMGVEMGEGVGGAAEGGVHGAIHFVEARSHRLSLLRHLNSEAQPTQPSQRREKAEIGLGDWKVERKERNTQTSGDIYIWGGISTWNEGCP